MPAQDAVVASPVGRQLDGHGEDARACVWIQVVLEPVWILGVVGVATLGAELERLEAALGLPLGPSVAPTHFEREYATVVGHDLNHEIHRRAGEVVSGCFVQGHRVAGLVEAQSVVRVAA